MRVAFPLFARISFRFLLNLLLLGILLYAFVRVQFHVGLEFLLFGRAGERLQLLGETITAELRSSPVADWSQILQGFQTNQTVRFFVFREDGAQIAGEPIPLPPEVMEKLRKNPPMPPRPPGNHGGFPDQPGPEGPPARPNRGPGPRNPPASPGPRFMVRTTDPVRYWVGIRMRLPNPEPGRPIPLTLLAASTSIRGGGLFFDLAGWVWVVFGAVLISAAFWFPFIRGVTTSLSQMTRATESIAEGRFDSRVASGRRDELGRLAQAINQMASRLSGFVLGQKRFLGDVAHELCSPIARAELALSILEEQTEGRFQSSIEDLREEIGEMSTLVNELLSFSKASLAASKIVLRPVNLRELAEKTLRREGSTAVEVAVEPGLSVSADPELLARALGNLVRNAQRYAGESGPIKIVANLAGPKVELSVLDSGPGVPEESLAKLFDPFYRPEDSRDRSTGGVGLGLAIVKTCVESCGGTVQCANRKPAGFEVKLTLDRAAAAPPERPS